MSRIAAVAAFVVLVAAGCGGGDARPQKLDVHGIPNALARNWEAQASAIAAAAARDDCHAQALARSLRTQVMQKRQLVPLRLRSPLVAGVDSLLARTTCTPTVPGTTTQAPKPHGPKPPKPHDHGHHGHHGHGGDQGGNQGGDG